MFPRWMRFLEKRLGWLAVSNLAIILVTLQALGFFFVAMDPIWIERFALVPDFIVNGEYWRLITFLALPLSTSPIWMLLVLWFLYYVVNAIESQWGAFKTTLYVLVSILLTVGFSFLFNYPVFEISYFQSTLFLAAAALFPEMEILLFFVIPVKMKWLALVTFVMVLLRFIGSDWLGRGYLLAIYGNYLLFFGAAHYYSLKQVVRRARFKSKMRD